MAHKILAVDDETSFLDSIKRGLITSGFKNITTESDPEKATALVENEVDFDLAIIDITMPKINGLQLLERIKRLSPETECIMITAIDEAKTAVTAMKKGAFDYLIKPVQKEELILSVNRALERKKLFSLLELGKGDTSPKLQNKKAFEGIITRSPSMIKILREAELHAASNAPVLITGESGTGKELLARAVHQASARAERRFTPVNMAALTPTLFDSEFFGHTKGAFTGADKARKGYLEHTDKGTLFLDEIGTLAPELQGKLLRVLQDGDYIKIGEDSPKKSDIRYIAATNENIETLVKNHKFRKDLYYRLKGGWIHIPPLRKRKKDIPLLAASFARELSAESPDKKISNTALDCLMGYHYPGNVRELKGIIMSALNLSRGSTICEDHLPPDLKKSGPEKQTGSLTKNREIVPLAEIEKKHILMAYKATGQNKTKTAGLLGIGLNTLRRKLDSYS